MSLITSAVKGLTVEAVDGRGLRVAVIRTQWNTVIVDALHSALNQTLTANGVASADIIDVTVPGAYELPFAAKSIILQRTDIDAVVCLGAVIRGGTPHFEYICQFVADHIGAVGLETGTPVVFGVLTVLNETQALERCGLREGSHNHGVDYGLAAIRMAKLKFKPEGSRTPTAALTRARL